MFTREGLVHEHSDTCSHSLDDSPCFFVRTPSDGEWPHNGEHGADSCDAEFVHLIYDSKPSGWTSQEWRDDLDRFASIVQGTGRETGGSLDATANSEEPYSP